MRGLEVSRDDIQTDHLHESDDIPIDASSERRGFDSLSVQCARLGGDKYPGLDMRGPVDHFYWFCGTDWVQTLAVPELAIDVRGALRSLEALSQCTVVREARGLLPSSAVGSIPARAELTWQSGLMRLS